MSNDSVEQGAHSAHAGGERLIRTAPISAASISAAGIAAGSISAARISADRIGADAIGAAKISAKPIIALPTIPATMRAAVYRGINDVLVRIDTCGICGTDLKKIHSGSHSAPRIFGHEMAGTIAMVGEGVVGFEIGDRVMAYHHIPCGKCYYCRKQTFAQCETYKKVGCTACFAPAGGGFAEYIRVMDWIVGREGKTAGLIKVPDDIDRKSV